MGIKRVLVIYRTLSDGNPVPVSRFSVSCFNFFIFTQSRFCLFLEVLRKNGMCLCKQVYNTHSISAQIIILMIQNLKRRGAETAEKRSLFPAQPNGYSFVDIEVKPSQADILNVRLKGKRENNKFLPLGGDLEEAPLRSLLLCFKS